MNLQKLITQVVLSIKKYPFRAILILGFVHGLIYVFMIPPWWHHEEPGHFEYVWLVANRDHWPQVNDYDNNLRRQIAESMFASGHGNLFNVSPKSLADDPINIGGIPVNRKPVYYWLVSLPLRLIREQSVLVQLYVARLISFVLFLLSLWLAWLTMEELIPKRSPLYWMVPFSLALLPGYVDNMTSVHDDVIGAVVAILFLWLSIRIIKRGVSPLMFAGWTVSIVVCFYSRDTTIPLVFLGPFVLLFRLFRQKTLPLIGALLLIGIVVGVKLFTLRDASQWFFTSNGDASNRLQASNAPFGDYVFSLPAGERVTAFGQSFAPAFIKPLRNKTMTLGVWMWADTPTQMNLPILEYRTPDGVVSSPTILIEVGTSPAFYTVTFDIPYEAGHTWLSIVSVNYTDQTASVYYDGFVLAEGQRSSSPPVFENDKLHSGSWDGKPFVNLIRNPSAERAWLGVSKIANILKARIYIDPALYLQTIQDIQGFGWYYQASISTLFQTFWGKAAAQIPLWGGFTYDVLQLISLLALAGIFIHIIQSPSLFKRPEILFMVFVTIAIWLPTLFRGAYWVFYFVPLVPYARYAYPAIIPTLLLINAGLLKSLQWITVRFGLPRFSPVLAYQTFMVCLAIYAIFSFGGYFHPWLQSFGFLVLFVSLAAVLFMGLRYMDGFGASIDK
jgi:hypothetical protein